MLALVLAFALLAVAVAVGIGLFHSWQQSNQRQLQAQRRAYQDWANPPSLDRNDWKTWERNNS